MVKAKRADEEKLRKIVKVWEKVTNLETEETNYLSIHSRDVNSYIAIKTDGKVKTKGFFAKAGLQKNPQNEICVDAVIESPYGIAAPAGLAPARLRIIHDAFKAALESAQGRKILEQLNQPLNYRSPQEFEQYARSAYAREKTRMEHFKAGAGGTPQ